MARVLAAVLCAGLAAASSVTDGTCAAGAIADGTCHTSATHRDHVMLQKAASASKSKSPRPQHSQLSLDAKTGAEAEAQKWGGGGSTVKVMSYNLFGWNAFNVNSWRKENVLNKIKSYDPDVLGAQEVELGGSSGYDAVKDQIVGATNLDHVGGSQFFKSRELEKHETERFDLMHGYWMSMTRFKHKDSGKYFLFFNSHWKHGYGMEQAETIAWKVKEKRDQYGTQPVIVVGDSNQFCTAHESEAWRYLQGENIWGKTSPVALKDTIPHDKGKSFSDSNNPDCRVDFVFASDDWSVERSYIDRDGMGADGTASDHAPLMVELSLGCDSWFCR